MLAKTHLLGGAVIGLGLATVLPYDPIVVTASAIGGSLIPDIDHAKSKISQNNPIFRLLSGLVNVFFTHRTFTHSLLFAGLIYWLLTYTPLPDSVRVGFVAGILSHLILDAMTTSGIKLFFPLKTTVRFPLTIKTGGPFEIVVFATLAVMAIYYGLEIFYKG